MQSLRYLAISALFALATGAAAQAPNSFHYQGRITDGAGNPAPDGDALIKFRIYDAATGGSILWDSDFRQVVVSDGLFSYTFGDTIPLPDSVFNDTARWLGVKLGTDPEISPRTRLTSVPYAHRVRKIGPEIRLGTEPGEQGEIRLEQGGTLGLEMDVISTGGGISFYDENGQVIGTMGTEQEGFGFFFGGNEFLSRYMSLQANIDGNGSQLLTILGDNSFLLFDGSKSGDSSLQLDNFAINDEELLESPGIAADISSGGTINITSTTDMQAIVGVTVQNNTPGYWVVEAGAQVGLSNTTSSNYISTQIDDSPGGSRLTNYYHNTGLTSPPNGGTRYLSTSHRRVFFKNSGIHNFYLEAMDGTGNGSKWLWNPVITATFYARSYGDVNTAMGTADGNLESEIVRGTDQITGEPTTSYTVDLRQLELEAARAKTRAEEARRRLMEAKAEEVRRMRESSAD